MPDAPVQAIQLDPNLLVNARHVGAADAYNYGQGAQDYREAQTVSTVMGARYNYGPEAYDVRERTTEYNTGQGAQDYRNSMTRSNTMSADYNWGAEASRIRAADESFRNSVDAYEARRALTENVREGTRFNYSPDQYEGVRITNKARALESDYLHGEQARGVRALESDYLHGEQARGFRALQGYRIKNEAESIAAGSEFNYGPGGVRSRDIRDENTQALTESTRAGSEFNYGRRAQRLQDAEYRARDIGNESAQLTYDQRQRADDAFGSLRDQNIRLDAERTNQQLELNAKVASTPVMQQQYMQMLKNQGTVQFQQSYNQLQNVTAQYGEDSLKNEAEHHRLLKVTADRRLATNRTLNAQDTTEALNGAFGADLDRQRTFGKGDYNTLLNQMENSLIRNPESAETNQEDYAKYIQKIRDSDTALSPQARNQLKRIERAVDYRSADAAISGTVQGLAAARDSGNGTAEDNRLLAAISATGINPQNPKDLKNLAYEKSDDGYTVRNTTRAGSTQPISEAEFNSAAAHHTLFTESGRKTETRSNILTRPGQLQDQMESVENSGFDLKTSKHYKEVYNSTIDHVDDKESYLKQTADNMQHMQKTAAAFNPYKGANADLIFEGLGYGENVLNTLGGLTKSLGKAGSDLGLDTSAGRRLKKLLLNNPDEAARMVEYYYNRQWGGMPKDMYQSGVDRQMRTFESNSPSATAGMDPLNREKFNRNMRTNIQTGMHNEVVADDLAEAGYNFAISVHPDLAIPGYMVSGKDEGPAKEDPRGLLTRISASIRGATIGLSKSDAFRTAAVKSSPIGSEFLEP